MEAIGPGAIRRWLRKQVFRPRYRTPPTEHLELVAADGVRLHAVRLPGPPTARASLVIVHGITNSVRSPRVFDLAHAVSGWAHVVVIDLRGHGRSAGVCTMGEFEPLDVASAVAAAHGAAPGLPVVVVGTSLGGLAAVLAAAAPEHVRPVPIAGVVSVSAPTRAEVDRPGTARMYRLCTTRRGRVAMRVIFRTRVRPGWWNVDDIKTVLPGRTAGFTLVLHDPDETYFGPEHAELLYDVLPEPKELRWTPGAGHGGDLLTPEFAAQLETDIRRRLSAAPR